MSICCQAGSGAPESEETHITIETEHWLRDEHQHRHAAERRRTPGTTHRLSIVLVLDHGPRCVHDLVDHLGASQSLVSQHLRVLRNSGLVTGERLGKETVYSLTDDHVGHIARAALSQGSGRNPLAPSPAARAAHES